MTETARPTPEERRDAILRGEAFQAVREGWLLTPPGHSIGWFDESPHTCVEPNCPGRPTRVPSTTEGD